MAFIYTFQLKSNSFATSEQKKKISQKVVEQYQNCYILQVSDGVSHFWQHNPSDIPPSEPYRAGVDLSIHILGDSAIKYET